nr:VIT1/CCC1 family protein [Corynebacterium atypicum]
MSERMSGEPSGASYEPEGGSAASAELGVRPSPRQIRRWRRYLANERAEAAVYHELAHRKEGTEREILLKLADSESRHEAYWRDKLGEYVGMPRQPDLATRFRGFLAKNFGSVFVLALMQSAEERTPYLDDADAPDQIAADERVHSEVVRGLAEQSRERISGGFRAAVFGANDGLVSNLALVLGIVGSGVSPTIVLLTGISGLLAGALSMAAGEYISVRSQAELLAATKASDGIDAVIPELDVNQNELALVYRARGLSVEDSQARAREVLARFHSAELGHPAPAGAAPVARETRRDGAWSAAISSFCCFALGALIPVLPFLFGASATTGAVVGVVLVSVALLLTGGVTGVLSGKPPLWRAVRQLGIGLAAAGITWALGYLFGAVIG